MDTRNNNFNLIRLLAATQVLLVHALNHFGVQGIFTMLMKATPGVPIFFFISGYLIGGSYQRKWHDGLGVYFRNRFLRIYPGLITCVAVSTLAVSATGFFDGKAIPVVQFIGWLLAQSTMFQFYNPEFMRPFGVGVLNGALWTISVELQFYLLVPLLFYAYKTNALISSIVFSISVLLNLFLRLNADSHSLLIKFLHVSFAPWLYMFMFGMLLAFKASFAATIQRIPFSIVLIVYILSMTLIGGYTINAQNAINPVAFFALASLIFKVALADLSMPRAFSEFITKNDFSYGLYLYHMPVINLILFVGATSGSASILAAVTISFVLSVISWYLIERPALQFKASAGKPK